MQWPGRGAIREALKVGLMIGIMKMRFLPFISPEKINLHTFTLKIQDVNPVAGTDFFYIKGELIPRVVLVFFQEDNIVGFAGQKNQKIHGPSTYVKEFAPSTEWCHANHKKEADHGHY